MFQALADDGVLNLLTHEWEARTDHPPTGGYPDCDLSIVNSVLAE